MSEQKREFKNPEASKNWGPGPWQNEPDRLEWRSHGFPCLVVRAPLGNLCGYVGVFSGHPWFEKDCLSLDVNIHGGLSYSDHCFGHICHVPQPEDAGQDDVWWVGFDCAHGWDFVPGLAVNSPSLIFRDNAYRDLDFLKKEVEDLALQAKEAASA